MARKFCHLKGNIWVLNKEKHTKCSNLEGNLFWIFSSPGSQEVSIFFYICKGPWPGFAELQAKNFSVQNYEMRIFWCFENFFLNRHWTSIKSSPDFPPPQEVVIFISLEVLVLVMTVCWFLSSSLTYYLMR